MGKCSSRQPSKALEVAVVREGILEIHSDGSASPIYCYYFSLAREIEYRAGASYAGFVLYGKRTPNGEWVSEWEENEQMYHSGTVIIELIEGERRPGVHAEIYEQRYGRPIDDSVLTEGFAILPDGKVLHNSGYMSTHPTPFSNTEREANTLTADILKSYLDRWKLGEHKPDVLRCNIHRLLSTA